MMIKRFFILLPLFCCLSFISCENEPFDAGPVQENENSNPDPVPDNFPENFGNEISRDFMGLVMDENRQPIENVSIQIGSTTTNTDENGVFLMKEATVYEHFAYITARKSGYLPGSRALIPSTGTNKVTIMLLEENIVGTTQSGTTANFDLPNGASVNLPGEYINKNGEPYSGTVEVIMHHLDPADEDMRYQMPGMLYAANTENEERILQSYGMLAVELRGSNNEKLNLAEGTTAEIRMPLSSDLMANAPGSIPLWHFDEEKGYWIEDGEATLEGNEYVGTVSHFSFWNCDIPFPTTNLCVVLTDENGNPLANTQVNLSFSNSNYPFTTTSGTTNANGEVCGLIPSGEPLQISVYNPDFCSNSILYSANIGPYSTNAIENISISLPASSAINESITGNFNTCNGNPVTDGYVKVVYNGNSYYDVVGNGTFSINLLRCPNTNNSFSIQGIDYNNQQTTGSINYTFTSPTTNLGNLTSCNTATEFIQYSIDNGATDVLIFTDISAVFEPMNPNYNVPFLNISAMNSPNNSCFFMVGILNSPTYTGTYDVLVNFPSSGSDTGFALEECIGATSTNNNIVFNLTSLGNVGSYIDMNFSGSYEDWQGNMHTVTGVIHVIRDN